MAQVKVLRRYEPKLYDAYGRKVSLNAAVSSYTGAGHSRALKEWIPEAGDAAFHITYDLDLLRRRSHDLVRNTPMGLAAVSTLTANVIGPGLRAQPQIDAEYLGLTEEQASTWERQARREFDLFVQDTLDVSNTLHFSQMQELVFRAALVSGDCFVLFPRSERRGGNPYRTRVQLIEGERVINDQQAAETHEYNNGIRRDEFGSPVSYTVASGELDGLVGGQVTYTDIPAFGERTGRRNVLHVFFPTRPNQPRGVPLLTPVMESLKQLTRYMESELMAAVVASLYTIFIKSELESTASVGQDLGKSQAPPGATASDLSLGSGSVVFMDPGESIDTANPTRPNTSFDPFFIAIMKQIGAALDIPLELLFKHFQSSYSASRGAMLMAWKHFMVRRGLMAALFCQPLYELFLEEAILLGRLRAPGFRRDPLVRSAYSKVEWVGSPMGTVDPVKDAKAQKEYLTMGVKTRSRITQETTGEYWEDTNRQLDHERKVMGGVDPIRDAATGRPTGPDEAEEDDDEGDNDDETGRARA